MAELLWRGRTHAPPPAALRRCNLSHRFPHMSHFHSSYISPDAFSTQSSRVQWRVMLRGRPQTPAKVAARAASTVSAAPPMLSRWRVQYASRQVSHKSHTSLTRPTLPHLAHPILPIDHRHTYHDCPSRLKRTFVAPTWSPCLLWGRQTRSRSQLPRRSRRCAVRSRPSPSTTLASPTCKG